MSKCPSRYTVFLYNHRILFMILVSRMEAKDPKADPIEEIVKQLKSSLELINNIAQFEGEYGEKKPSLVESIIKELTEKPTKHYISTAMHLTRELVDSIAKHFPQSEIEDDELESPFFGNIPDEYFPGDEKVKAVGTSRITVTKDKISWKHRMTEPQKNKTLKLSDHPYWVTAVFYIWDRKGNKGNTPVERRRKLLRFFEVKGKWFAISEENYISICEERTSIYKQLNKFVHEPTRFEDLGGYLFSYKEIDEPNIEMEEQKKNLNEVFDALVVFLSKFQLLPPDRLSSIGKLDFIDEIADG